MRSFEAKFRIVRVLLLAAWWCNWSALIPVSSSSSSWLWLTLFLVPIHTHEHPLCTAAAVAVTATATGSDGKRCTDGATTTTNNNCEAVYSQPESDDSNNDHDEDEEDDDDDDDDDDYDAIDEDYPSECSDLADPAINDCKALAEGGECNTNPGFMKYQCALSCGTCHEFNAAYAIYNDTHERKKGGEEESSIGGVGPCTDLYRECKQWAGQGECAFNPDFMLVQCERSCMICFEDT